MTGAEWRSTMPQMTAQHMVRQERRDAHVFGAHLHWRCEPCRQMRNNVPNGCFRRQWDLVMSTERGCCALTLTLNNLTLTWQRLGGIIIGMQPRLRGIQAQGTRQGGRRLSVRRRGHSSPGDGVSGFSTGDGE